ncbi:HAMP domain-containing histidine kinase [Sphingomonas rhizophila]|uniref:histidine kinase n=1 Tax=Sphingomonas rhizophila TaxID=2071607 RepID=A0A7G9SDD0_9SPHN|nr:HAMP domain-containing sensor histidine kinase [Sphingomonas rhizophila]QNN65855.1 HAMP domain-containing histidine kinase [Sphingomonas rhizophila]
MRFDDRLKTVLDSPVGDSRDRAVRWRQLVDLLSRARGDADAALVDRAIQAARDDRSSVPDTVRAATARSIAGRPLDPRLIALFASDVLEVAAPLLAGATLDDDSRREIEANASDEVRRFFFALEGPAARIKVADMQAPEIAPAAKPPGEDEIPSIGEAVARIEQLRRERAGEAAGTPVETDEIPDELPKTAPEPVRREPALFRWESDALGLIAWVEGAPRAALIGRSLAGHAGEALLSEECRDLVARRAPFADVPLASADPFGGEWRVSGAPAFAPGDGRFIGYRGMARRIDLTPSQRAAVPRAFEGADTLREMIHEIKTPLNAIIGFAEIIDGQYLGPAHRRYRERAGEILVQARELLGAIEDLDFAAKLQSSRSAPGEGTDLSVVLPEVADRINARTEARGVEVSLQFRGRGQRTALDPALSSRLAERFISAIVDALPEGETLAVEVGVTKGQCAIAATRPAPLAELETRQLFDPGFTGPSGQRIGLGFAFRLVRGLARIAGGDLIVDDTRFVLTLPTKK